MKRIAVLTSGGDAPGMNAAIRAVVRTGLAHGVRVWGVRDGYRGLIDGAMNELGSRDVAGIIEKGGSLLGSSRCPEFKTGEGRTEALNRLNEKQIEGLIVIGGDGSQKGSYFLSRAGFPVAGIASTIDNDLSGCDVTIGVDTAINTVLFAIDRIKTTASSHHRAFLIEVMGRDCGYLALMSGIAGGAEVIAIPEVEIGPEEIARELQAAYQRGKRFAIAVIAEGIRIKTPEIAAYFKEHRERIGFDLRITALGHLQRGGSPSAFDRLLATRLGSAALEALLQGKKDILAGLLNGKVALTPLEEIVNRKKPLDMALFELSRKLAG